MKFRLTKSREMILNLLNNKQKPLNAEMIYELLDEKIYLSTVYRNLELFLENNLVSRLFINNTAYYYINKTDHKHFMVCLGCHDMFEIPCSHFDEGLLGDHQDFKISSHELTVYGYCSSCQL
ncbi:MAG: transcriptional repressor [Acholeplasmataceae bacterium]|nr:transcriptional repressor [Acholeplasmataceae bacterium]